MLAALAPKFKEATGATVKVDILNYPDLATKTQAISSATPRATTSSRWTIVWSGQYAEAGYTVDLTDWIKRDAAEIKVDDIYPSLMSALGGYKGKQVAFPFAGYANVLAYRKDLYAPPAEAADDDGRTSRRFNQADQQGQEAIRLRRQWRERSGRRAGLDAV